MSIAFRSSGFGAWPTPKVGDCANTTAGLPTTAAAHISAAITLRAVAIGDLPVGRHLPHLDAVVVILRVDAADLYEICERRLRVAGVVSAARRDQRLTALPRPWPLEARVRARPPKRLPLPRHPPRTSLAGDLGARR